MVESETSPGGRGQMREPPHPSTAEALAGVTHGAPVGAKSGGLRRYLRTPRYADPEETRVASTLHVISVSGLIMIVLAMLASSLYGHTPGVLGTVSGVVILVIAFLAHNGHANLGAHVLAALGWLAPMGLFFMPGYASGSIASTIFLVNTFSATLLLSTWGSRAWVALMLVTGAALEVIREPMAAIAGDRPEWGVTLPTFAVGIVIAYFAASRARAALQQAWKTQRTLEERNRELLHQTRERRQLEERFHSLVEQAPVGVVVFDRSLTLVSANEAAQRMVGSESVADLVGMQKEEMRVFQMPEIREAVEMARDQGRQVRFETRWLSKWGKQVEVRGDVGPIRNAANWIDGVIAILEDVSNERSLQDQLLQSQKMAALGQLAGGVAHDFNNYLTVILGNAERACLDLPKESAVQPLLTEISRAAIQSGALTRQLLAFSRRHVFEPRVFDVNDLVTGVDRMARRLVGDEIQVDLVLEPDCGSVNADPAQIEQVMVNLVVNARDAMPNGGKLALSTAAVTLDGTESGLLPEASRGKYLRISVSDDGIGIPEEIRDQIFDPFFTTKGEGEGTGLGLAMALSILERCHGAVAVHSTVGGGGTVVHLYLPHVSQEHAQAASAPAEMQRGAELVLLVEDENALRSLTRRHLERYGYEVIEAHDGVEALKRAAGQDRPIDVLLTDLSMPGMGGAELADALARTHPETRVLYMSGYVPDGPAGERVREAGEAFLQKPFQLQELLARIRRILDRPD